MDTFQIGNILNKKLGAVFMVVNSCDQLASLKACAPACYIVNTKASASPGERWVAIHMWRNRTAVYFDYFDFPPEHTEIIKFLQNTP